MLEVNQEGEDQAVQRQVAEEYPTRANEPIIEAMGNDCLVFELPDTEELFRRARQLQLSRKPEPRRIGISRRFRRLVHR